MNVYIFDERTDGAIVDICTANRVTVLTHHDAMKRRKHPSLGLSFLDQVDALILDITRPSQDVQFILAHALLLQKPTLCVYAKNYPPRDVIAYIKKQPAPRSIKTFSYSTQSLAEGIRRFVAQQHVDPEERDVVPSIKYTLRMTPQTDRYIQWLSEKERKTKAIVLREIFAQMALNDAEYQADQHARE